jgi:hypothetical protein
MAFGDDAMDRTRVVFNFDDRSLTELKRLTASAGFPTMAATIRAALSVVGTIEQARQNGDTQLIVRNPSTGSQRVIEP